MNSQIEKWRVQQYAANVYHLSQQKDSRLRNLVRKESFGPAKAEFFDRIGLATAVKKTARNSDTPNLNIDHSRRMLTTSFYEWATLVDKKDKLQNIHDPENEYSKAARMAMGRAMDTEIIQAALGTAKYGEDGSSSQTLGTGNKVVSVDSAAIANGNVQVLRKAKFLFDAADVDPMIPRYLVHNASFLEALLAETETTSSDYASIKALVRGEINEFMGFTWVLTELITSLNADLASSQSHKYNTTTGLYDAGGTLVSAATSAVSQFAFASDGLISGIGMDLTARVDERADKSYSMQPYSAMDVGAVRMEEPKVVEIICEQGA